MRKIKIILLFQKKIFILSLILSVVIANVFASNLITGIALSYLMISPLIHYFAYEVMRPQEYYFYYNLGFSRSALWLSTIAIGVIIILISFIL